MSLNSPTVAECESALILFWNKLTLNQKRNLGNATVMNVAFEGTSAHIMEIVQAQIVHLGIGEESQKEFEYALDRYQSLSTGDQQSIRSRLANYFH